MCERTMSVSLPILCLPLVGQASSVCTQHVRVHPGVRVSSSVGRGGGVHVGKAAPWWIRIC